LRLKCEFCIDIIHNLWPWDTREFLLRDKINWHRKKPFPPKDFAGIERLVGELAKAVGAVSFV